MRRADHLALLDHLAADGLVLEHVSVPRREVVHVKSLIESYPGIGSVHAPPGRELGERTSLVVATAPGFVAMMDGILAELEDEVGLMRGVRDTREETA
ncbi:MAG: hypothetical protein KC731_17430 [Myxococcales bacterium]|nr:hypothetical protein [Myxococcales bacterium]